MKQVRFGKLVDVPSRKQARFGVIPIPEAKPVLQVGVYGGLCQRTACRKPGAFCRHRDNTGRHYCHDCAREINRACRDDAMANFGHSTVIEIPENIRELKETLQ